MTDRRRSVCCVRGCRRVARQAFDVFNPWAKQVFSPDWEEDRRHYEVCDRCAAELWPNGVGYLNREQAQAIRAKAVAM